MLPLAVAACGARGRQVDGAPVAPEINARATEGDMFGPASDAGPGDDAAGLVVAHWAAYDAAQNAADAAQRKLEQGCLDAGLVVTPPPTEILGGPDLCPLGCQAREPCSTPRFDRGAAAASLGGLRLRDCKSPRGPKGSGHAKITFASSGNVASVTVDPPFAGTSVGACIATELRRAQVPSFVGSPVTVGKAFSVE
jgi:hypothetical protein